MDEMLKITKNILLKIFSRIKTDIKEKDRYIIAAALQGKVITEYSGSSVPTAAKKKGNLLYRKDTKKYGYWNNKFVQMTIDDIITAVNTNELSALRGCWKVSPLLWTQSTPFNILNGVVTDIYKGETVGGNTKWILIPYKNEETQTYTAGTTANPLYYGTYNYDHDKYAAPWELWLPSNLAVNTVVLDLLTR